MLAYCGLQCDTCPIFLATLEPDELKQQNMRKSIAGVCLEHYKINLKPDEITDCDGCTSNSGRIFTQCFNCQVRTCAKSKKLKSCAYCEDFPCNKLNELFVLDPKAKMRLEELRKSN